MPAGSCISNHVSTMYLLACGHVESGKVSVPGCSAKAVVNHNQPAVAWPRIRRNNNSVCSRVNRSTVLGGNVHAPVKFTFTTERIQPLAEAGGDLPGNRPQRRRKRCISQARLTRKQVQPLLRQRQRRCALLQEIKLLNRMAEISLRGVRNFRDSERSVAQLHKSVAHGNVSSQGLERVETLIGILDAGLKL